MDQSCLSQRNGVGSNSISPLDSGYDGVHETVDMKIISWNIRGLGAREKRSVIRSIINKQKPDVVCIQETMLVEMSKENFESIWNDKEIKWVFCPACGKSGGLLMAWDNRNFEGGSFSMGTNWQVVIGKFKGGLNTLKIFNIYGPVDRKRGRRHGRR